MKLFDYKFLILLGLTLVVYFMFREIIDLRNKIDVLETQIKNIEYNPKTNTNSISDKSNMNKVSVPKIVNKPVFQIPLPKLNTQSTDKKEKNIISLSAINEQDGDDTEVESESLNSDNIEKLEIYSNDNIDNEDDYSIGDSSEIDLNAIENELKEVSDIGTNSETNLELENDNNQQNDDESSEKKKNLLVEFEGTKLLDEIKDNIQMTSDLDVDNILSSNTHSHTSDIKSSQSGEYSYKSLMRLKLSDLQCLAEEKNISLLNEEKGKNKTKSELSNDLINF